MAAGTWTFTTAGQIAKENGEFALATDSFKMALFLSTSNLGAASTTYAGVTNEHANANGYTTGGIAVTLAATGNAPTMTDISTDPVWTASGGSIVAKFATIYEVGGKVLCYCLLDSGGADVTTTTGNTFTIAPPVTGVYGTTFA